MKRFVGFCVEVVLALVVGALALVAVLFDVLRDRFAQVRRRLLGS